MGYSPWGRKESDTTGRLSTVYRFSDCSLSVCYIIFPIKTFSGLSTFVSSINSNGMWWFSLGVSCTRENSMLSSENDEGWKTTKLTSGWALVYQRCSPIISKIPSSSLVSAKTL